MLFHSYIFVFVFYPCALLGTYYFANQKGYRKYTLLWIVTTSLLFYSWLNPFYLLIIGMSITFNYVLSRYLCHSTSVINKRRKFVVIIGVLVNISILWYFKYSTFTKEIINNIFNSGFILETVALPLGISFFTFQQVAYLFDSYNLETQKHTFLEYCLFISFFPQLIAGPIVNHKDIFPQFSSKTLKITLNNIYIGLTFFSIGVFKKVIFADGIAPYADLVFNAASEGQHLSFGLAWLGALSFSFQIYFDFSGYTDMALGLAFMFGLSLPINFFSPYKALNIIDFWHRWHMSLTRFFRNYLYIPLGGSRSGSVRQYLNICITMLLCGIWHGSGWTYLAWGGVHAIYIIVNHGWHKIKASLGLSSQQNSSFWRAVSRSVCFVAVVVAWVLFRADSITIAFDIIKHMLLFPDICSIARGAIETPPQLSGLNSGGLSWPCFLISAMVLITFFCPNTHEIMAKSSATLLGANRFNLIGPKWFQWRKNIVWGLLVGTTIMINIIWMAKEKDFIYFLF